jgi:AmmeMemoRadiSam system protein B
MPLQRVLDSLSEFSMDTTVVRPPAVAGRFYPAQPEILIRELEKCLSPALEPIERIGGALGCVVPHAGYKYSGHVAGAVYRKLPLRKSYIIIGPNHFARGAPLAMTSCGAWATPLGNVPVDQELATALRDACPLIKDDPVAHSVEHSLEVQLPFLQHQVKDFRFVPVGVIVGEYEALEYLGQCVAEVARAASNPPMIIASTDLNHYEPDDITRIKDHKAIERILALAPEGLYDVVHREKISMCGYGPTVATLVAVKQLGAQRAELVKYATSAEISGDRGSVVGYAGMIFS